MVVLLWAGLLAGVTLSATLWQPAVGDLIRGASLVAALGAGWCMRILVARSPFSGRRPVRTVVAARLIGWILAAAGIVAFVGAIPLAMTLARTASRALPVVGVALLTAAFAVAFFGGATLPSIFERDVDAEQR